MLKTQTMILAMALVPLSALADSSKTVNELHKNYTAICVTPGGLSGLLERFKSTQSSRLSRYQDCKADFWDRLLQQNLLEPAYQDGISDEAFRVLAKYFESTPWRRADTVNTENKIPSYLLPTETGKESWEKLETLRGYLTVQ